MLTRTELLLTCVVDECSLLAIRASNTLRFGLDDIYPELEKTNAELLEIAINNLSAALILCREDGFISSMPDYDGINQKRRQIEGQIYYAEHLRNLTK